jgi:hypothetical protein
MGRYYWGDIEGKFMFAVQESNAADRFGATGSYPNVIEYHFDEDHLEDINEELKKLKPGFDRCNNFFQKIRNNGKVGYSTDDLESFGISDTEMSDYADYKLGIKIKNRIEEDGVCSFTAEL